MKSRSPRLMLIALLLMVCSAAEGRISFDRYRIILDRKPFGEAPPPEPEPVVIPEAEKFERNFRMSAIVEFEDVWKIGLIELKTNEDFYLAEGETQKGVELLSVDWDAEEATIQKGIEIVTLKLGTGEVVSRNTANATNSAAAVRPNSGPPPGAARPIREAPVQNFRGRRGRPIGRTR